MHPRKRKLRPRPDPIPTTSQQQQSVPAGGTQQAGGLPHPDKHEKPENPYQMFLSIRRQVSALLYYN